MVIPLPERGRVLPNDEGMAALKAWVESAPDMGQKAARALHIKSLHTKRGIGAKTLSFFWLDIPFRAAGAAVRAGYNPSLTCPLCVALAESGLTPRGKISGRQPAPPGLPQATTPDIDWLMKGKRYLLGYTFSSPYYGIWDTAAPGPPILRFPYTDHGKAESERKFQELEADVELESDVTPPPASPSAAEVALEGEGSIPQTIAAKPIETAGSVESVVTPTDADTGEDSVPLPPDWRIRHGVAFVGEEFSLCWETGFVGQSYVIRDNRENRVIARFWASGFGWLRAWQEFKKYEPDPQYAGE